MTDAKFGGHRETPDETRVTRIKEEDNLFPSFVCHSYNLRNRGDLSFIDNEALMNSIYITTIFVCLSIQDE